ncbi:MAG: hypothetical protein ABJE47_10810 [bacterium]
MERYTEDRTKISTPSRGVAFVAGYYRATSAISAAALGFGLLYMKMIGAGRPLPLAGHGGQLTITLVGIASGWWTGTLIKNRQRSGAWMAVTSIGVSILAGGTHVGLDAIASVCLGAIGLAAIRSIWDELE